MNLKEGIVRPARIIEVIEGGMGNIKVEAPGLFSAEDKENLPPVMPFPWRHTNAFSMPVEGDEVWVLSYKDNPQSLHWFRKDDLAEIDQSLLEGKRVEILMHRESGAGWCTIRFEDGSGLTMSNGVGVINIRPNGTIKLTNGNPNRTIDICGGSISLGSEGGSSHSGAYGDEIKKALEIILAKFNLIQQAAASNAYTVNIASALANTQDLADQIPKVESENVTLD